MLGVLRHAWAPGAYVVSFKLETDEALLLSKAQGALDRWCCCWMEWCCWSAGWLCHLSALLPA